MLNHQIWAGILLPFLGTCLGAALAFFMRSDMNSSLRRCLTGFAAGVMIAASVWSLLIPSLQQAASGDVPAFVPAVVGFWAGIFVSASS